MRRLLRGLDEMALESAFIGVSSLVFIVVASWALNSSASHQLDRIPVLGQVVGGARVLVGQVSK